ncbi:MFS transporter [Coleofasciculus sp. G2-EDA-02]|uniref:MFS transporter n=1 Tax=Coleofasciculus sp. G2-EDA-02 TaxID=3069529 RepID=UPI0032F79147
MFQSVGMMVGLYHTPPWLAKVPAAPTLSPVTHAPEPAALVFSGPQFFIALIAGVLMAFAFQFLLTNFTLAAGISAGDNLPDADESETWGSKISKVESKVGVWALVTVNIALFIACFLAVKLTLINSLTLGAITGVVIWSAYFLLLLWVSSTAMGSVVGSVANTAGSGWQGVMTIATTALGGSAANAQIVNTVEESVAAVRRELSSAVDPTRVQETVQDYVADLAIPKLNLKQIRNDLENLLSGSELRSIAESDILENVNRQTFVDLVSSRTDLSKQDINGIADQLEAAWQQVLGKQQQTDPQAKLLNFLQEASPEELTSGQLGDKLGQLVGVGAGKSNGGNGNGGFSEQALQLGVSALMSRVLSRTDLSDIDVEKISDQLQQLKEKATEQAKNLSSKVAERLPGQPFNTIKADVENYLLDSKPWHLNRETIKQEFKEVIYDPEAAPKAVRQQLEQLNRDDFVNLLESRDNFTSEKIADIADQLEGIRQEVLESVQGAESEEYSQDIRTRVENYLRNTNKEELNPEGIEQDFQALLDDPQGGIDAVRQRLSQFDRDTLVQLLSQRDDFSQEEVEQRVGQLESTRDRVLSQAQELQDQGKSKADELRGKVEEYLRNTNKEELNPDAIEQELQTLLDDPQAGLSALRQRLSQFDRDTLVQLLNQREDLSQEEINQVIDQFLNVRNTILNAPRELAGSAKEQYEQIKNKIAEYLRNTNLEELDPEGIKQDLGKILDDPKQGALSMRERLSQVDRETLVKLLSQREDLSEEDVNRIIDQVQDGIQSLVKAPRRLASRGKDKVQDVQSNFEEYLRNTDKEELNPEAIKRELKQLFNDPSEGWKSVSDRLSHFDRSTLAAPLSQREDISAEDVNRIADNIDSVRNQFVEQAQAVQHKLQSTIDSIFARIRNYLNSLELPEPNYEGTKRDMRKLFDDPEAGFDALRSRLSQFDRDTLVAPLSSRDDLSQADANRLIEQIEGARDRVPSRAERLQEEAQKRVKQLKHKANQQVKETRKAAATAARWLFGTALTSVGVAALAGVLAAGGSAIFG